MTHETSLPKIAENSDLRRTRQIIHHSNGFDKSYPKIYSAEFENNVKSQGHLSVTLAYWRIWSAHVTQVANFHESELLPLFLH